jgi:DNA-binding SARP family transcriptional activator
MIEVKLFGSTVVLVDGVPLAPAELGGVKPRQILEMLAVDIGTPVSKDRLADRLWEDQPPASYVATLESYVCVLRRRLGAGRGKASPITTTRNGYLLDPVRTRVDLAEFRTLMTAAADGAPEAATTHAEQALGLMSGELLADEPYVTWAGREREKLSELVAAGCTRAAQVANADGESARAVRFARTAADQGFSTEAAWQELIRALWSSGRRAEGLRAYADLRAGMLDELGIEPGPASQGLYMTVLRGSSGHGASHERHEVRTLLRLLRQALEAGPGMDVATEPGLSEVARLLLRHPA